MAILKDYKIKRKLTIHRSIRNKGFEKENIVQKGQAGNDLKLEESISRAKSKIFELAYCNKWDKFITMTFDPILYNRYDLSKIHKDVTKWIGNYNKKYGTKLKFLLIPEMHKDGAWHMHGLIMGLPDNHLIKNHNGYLDWLPYRKKFGYCSIDQIKNHEAVAKYITKYVSKNLADCIKDINAHMYYCSRGLERAIEIKRGTLTGINVPWDYENDWIKSKWFTEISANLGSLIN